jgi:hypothetical protein
MGLTVLEVSEKTTFKRKIPSEKSFSISPATFGSLSTENSFTRTLSRDIQPSPWRLLPSGNLDDDDQGMRNELVLVKRKLTDLEKCYHLYTAVEFLSCPEAEAVDAARGPISFSNWDNAMLAYGLRQSLITWDCAAWEYG